MIISPTGGNSSGGFGGFSGFGSSAQPTVDQLIAAAVAQGGAVGAAAEQFSTPKKSFFASLTDKSLGALDKFVSTLQTGSYAIRGILDPDITIREAIERRETPGEMFIEDAGLGATRMEKFRTGAMRFAVDTLLDPLTYVTFGASRGLLGLSQGAEALADANLASKLTLKEGNRVFLTPEAEDVAARFVNAKREGLNHTYLVNERIKLVNAGVPAEEIPMRLKKIEDETSDYLIAQTLDAKIDMRDATQLIANLAGKNTQLLSKWIDKGGIKFFGQTLLSGQRIRSVLPLLPGMTILDRATEPIRKFFADGFNTNYQNGVRLPDTYIQDEQKWKDLMLSSGREIMKDGYKLKSQLNLSPEEWEFVSAAIEHGLKPRDPKAADVWNIVHGMPPVNGTVRDEVWQGMIGVQKLKKQMKRNLQASGALKIKGHENYIQHILVDTPLREAPVIPKIGAIKSDRSKFASISTLIDDAGKRVTGFLNPETGKFSTRLKDAVTEEVADVEMKFKPTETPNQFIDEDTGAVFKRVRARIDEARELGVSFEDNALVLSIAESAKASRLAIARYFSRDIASKFGVPISKADSSYVPINKTGFKNENIDFASWMVDKNGEQLVFHPAVAARITEFAKAADGEELNKLFRAYDSIQNYFKAAVTAIFPAFHGRNALSNVFLMFNKIGYEALNPANHVATANMMNMQRRTVNLQRKLVKGTASAKEYSELMLTPVYTDRTGYQWTWGEMRQQLIDNVIAFHPKNVGMVDQMRFGFDNIGEAAQKMFPKDKLGKAINYARPFNPLDSDNLLFTGGYKLAGTIEDYSRTLTFLAQLKSTGDPLQASRITKLALFDYANLTKFEKEVMRRIIPFYTFTRKNLELQVNTLLTTPGKMAAQIRGVQSLGEAFGGEPLTEEEVKKLPEWAREGYRLVVGREGSHITLLKSIGTPIEETLSRTSADANLGIISPLIKTPLEMMSGYSFFHGRPISEVTKADAYKNAPESIKNFIGFEEVKYVDRDGVEQVYYTSFNPQNMYLIQNLPLAGRLTSEVGRFERQETSSRKALALAFGIDTQEYDLDAEAAKIEKRNREELQKILEQAGIGYTFSRYVPEK